MVSSVAPLYLFKTARRPIYLKENLHILAAERGSIVEASYNRMWIAPEYFDEGSIARGTTACFIFTERPYSRFVPVRTGEVVGVTRTDLTVRVRVLLRSWVGLENRSIEEFTRDVKESGNGNAPGAKFLIPGLADTPLLAYYDEREHAGWCGVVDNVLRMSAACDDHP